MKCPLELNLAGTLGTVDYLEPCGCVSICDLTNCCYRRNGFLVQINSKGATTTNTVCIVASKCGGSIPLVAESNSAVVTEADLTVGTVYRIYPSTVGGILRGVVQGI